MHLSMYSNNHPHKPEILSYASSGHYLVRVADANGELQILTDVQGKMHTFNSQFEAENWLHQQGHTQAMLCFETPYDELAGEDGAEPSKLEIPLSH